MADAKILICDDEPAMRALAAGDSGAALDAADHAVIDFATQVARDASAITGTRKRSRYSSATCAERQFELTRENSRTTKPSM